MVKHCYPIVKAVVYDSTEKSEDILKSVCRKNQRRKKCLCDGSNSLINVKLRTHAREKFSTFLSITKERFRSIKVTLQ